MITASFDMFTSFYIFFFLRWRTESYRPLRYTRRRSWIGLSAIAFLFAASGPYDSVVAGTLDALVGWGFTDVMASGVRCFRGREETPVDITLRLYFVAITPSVGPTGSWV